MKRFDMRQRPTPAALQKNKRIEWIGRLAIDRTPLRGLGNRSRARKAKRLSVYSIRPQFAVRGKRIAFGDLIFGASLDFGVFWFQRLGVHGSVSPPTLCAPIMLRFVLSYAVSQSCPYG